MNVGAHGQAKGERVKAKGAAQGAVFRVPGSEFLAYCESLPAAERPKADKMRGPALILKAAVRSRLNS
jgi:hypothetical protein